MFEPPPPGSAPTAQSQGYPQVPGKHRKRKAPDTDPIQPAAASDSDEEADVAAAQHEAAGDDNSGGSHEETGVLSDEEEQRAVSSGEQIPASISGRHDADQEHQPQTLSYAGEQRCHGA